MAVLAVSYVRVSLFLHNNGTPLGCCCFFLFLFLGFDEVCLDAKSVVHEQNVTGFCGLEINQERDELDIFLLLG